VYFDLRNMAIDWQSMFVPTESITEIVIRGTIMYIGMFALLRIFRRQAGAVGIADLLVIVVIADAAQNGMAGDSRSITEAMILIAVIVLWDYAFDLLGYRSSLFARLLAPKALLLIKNGEVIVEHLKKELITEEELKGQLREQGIEDLSEVRECYLESNGHFSVLKRFAPTQKQSNESTLPTVN
jgi:uncharacterized membrane protein YcaP (DUF421 family)